MPSTPTIPQNITVHLGAPDSDARNVTVPFTDYIKNVASSEIYPTWPREAIKANVLAQISVALNRVYTQFYRSKGYDFDITSSPAYDQTYVYQRDIFANVSEIVDEVFDSYIRKAGKIEPLFAEFCDGVEVSCNGLTQWGSVSLAEDGYDYRSILRTYYGDDIEIVTNVPLADRLPTAPDAVLREGDTGRDVELIQRRLNRISTNFPGIPKIYPVDGFFGRSTTDAVKKFQEVFGLTPDGIVGRATWYEIQEIYTAVKRLYAVNSEGLNIDELGSIYTNELSVGDRGDGVLNIQYFLSYISLFVPSVLSTAYDGAYGPSTEAAVKSFQESYGLPVTGSVNRATWDKIESVYYDIVADKDFKFYGGAVYPFPGRVLSVGSVGDDVRLLQEYLNYISDSYPDIPKINVDGDFGTATENAVLAFKRRFGLPDTTGRVNAVTWNAISDVYDDLYTGNTVRDGQYPGYDLT